MYIIGEKVRLLKNLQTPAGVISAGAVGIITQIVNRINSYQVHFPHALTVFVESNDIGRVRK